MTTATIASHARRLRKLRHPRGRAPNLHVEWFLRAHAELRMRENAVKFPVAAATLMAMRPPTLSRLRGNGYECAMARWTFDHAARLVEVVLEGDSTLEEAERFFEEVEAAGAVPYRKLFDCTNATPKIDEKIMGLVANRIASYKDQNRGPLAVVVQGAYFDGLAKLFLLAVDLGQRTRLFKSVAEARLWLDAVALQDAEAGR